MYSSSGILDEWLNGTKEIPIRSVLSVRILYIDGQFSLMAVEAEHSAAKHVTESLIEKKPLVQFVALQFLRAFTKRHAVELVQTSTEKASAIRLGVRVIRLWPSERLRCVCWSSGAVLANVAATTRKKYCMFITKTETGKTIVPPILSSFVLIVTTKNTILKRVG